MGMSDRGSFEYQLRLRLEVQDWRCARCGVRVEAGDELVHDELLDALVHAGCVATYTAPARVRDEVSL